jgi:hypothetical protein
MTDLVRTFLLTLNVVTLFAPRVFSQEVAPARLEVSSAGKVQSLKDTRELTVKYWLQELMLSALYRDVIQEVPVEEWQQRLSAPSRIYCSYSSTVSLAIPERETLAFDEVLLALPTDHYPDGILIKHAQRVLRLGKYDPWVLNRLMLESGIAPYPGLANVERALF